MVFLSTVAITFMSAKVNADQNAIKNNKNLPIFVIAALLGTFVGFFCSNRLFLILDFIQNFTNIFFTQIFALKWLRLLFLIRVLLVFILIFVFVVFVVFFLIL